MAPIKIGRSLLVLVLVLLGVLVWVKAGGRRESALMTKRRRRRRLLLLGGRCP